MAELRNIEVVTPLDPELSAGIVCCEVSGKVPFEVVDILRKEHGISTSVTPYREPYLRLGPSIVTSPDEVDAAVAALGALR